MVYITLGTQPNDFSRCLREVEKLICNGVIQDEVVAQVGYSSYKPQGVECYQFVSEEEYQRYIAQASVVISHAGSGAIFSAIKKGKKTIAVARLSKYGEMINDHQLELVRKLSEDGYILDGTFNLEEAWRKIDGFVPRKNDFSCEIVGRIAGYFKQWGISAK